MSFTNYDLEKIGASRVEEYIKYAAHDHIVADALKARHKKNEKQSVKGIKPKHWLQIHLRHMH